MDNNNLIFTEAEARQGLRTYGKYCIGIFSIYLIFAWCLVHAETVMEIISGIGDFFKGLFRRKHAEVPMEDDDDEDTSFLD